MTESTTVNTGNSVVENPENTTQPAVNSEAVQSKQQKLIIQEAVIQSVDIEEVLASLKRLLLKKQR